MLYTFLGLRTIVRQTDLTQEAVTRMDDIRILVDFGSL
jgi:hypothetical protein